MIPEGFLFSAMNAGVKGADSMKLDLGLVFCTQPTVSAAVFTRNAIKAAPVIIGTEIIQKGSVRVILANSGNANACTGQRGIEDARSLMAAVANCLGLKYTEVFPLSTGVIGVRMPIERMLDKIPALVRNLADNLAGFANSIMTTDTFPKVATRKVGKAKVLGIAKGAGMIAPNMATTLAVVLTDAQLDQTQLNEIINESVIETFNAITVDGDTSTNDTLVALSSCMVKAEPKEVRRAIREVMHELALMVVKDGEGATKLVNVRVEGAPSDGEACKVAMSVAKSLLVKTALFGEDPNWGRIMCAIGYSGVAIDPDCITIKISGLPVVEQGQEALCFNEQKVHEALNACEITIEIGLGNGIGSFQAWTTDISYKYVEINASYRT